MNEKSDDPMVVGDIEIINPIPDVVEGCPDAEDIVDEKPDVRGSIKE